MDRRALVRAAAACASEALELIDDSEARPREAVEAAERWAAEGAVLERCHAERCQELAEGGADPVVSAAAQAALGVLLAIDDPSTAPMAAAAAAQAAVFDAGDCAMQSALAYTQRRCADHVRATLGGA